MTALLLVSVALIMFSSWLVSIVFLQFPNYIVHGFDWTVSWIHVFDGVGHWLTIVIGVLIISWFLEE